MMSRVPAALIGGVPRVILLPRSELDRRERERLTVAWARVVIGAILLAAVLIGAAFAWHQVAQQRLAAEQARTAALIGEIGALADVSAALQTEGDLVSYRADAMGSDLAWSGILSRVRGALPADVTLTGFDLTPGAVPDAAAASGTEAATAAAEAAVGLTGTITVSSATPREMAPYVRALRAVQGVSGADANATATSSATTGSYVYTIDITFDQTVYSNSYAPAAEEAEK